MKKLFAMLALMGAMTLSSVPVMAQDAPEAAVVEEGGIHKELKTKYIEGGADFMSLPAIALVLGLAFCIERIIYSASHSIKNLPMPLQTSPALCNCR